MANTPLYALTGIRVLELADDQGVYCGKLLADMGADVIKVERPGGDSTRWVPPFLEDREGPERGLFFLYTNTNKRSVCVDLTCDAGQRLFRRMAQTAHLIVETFPPGTLDSLGLGYEALRSDNPGLVVTSITGFGQTGPQRHFRSSDLIASALGGAMYVTGEAEDPPVTLAGSQAHMMASAFAAAASLIALRHSAVHGVGQHVDISTEETTAAVTHICGAGKWLDDGIIPRRMGTGLFASVPSGAYPCTDGLVYLMVNRPLHWSALAKWIHEETGNEVVLQEIFDGPSSNRAPYRDLLDDYIAELTRRHTVAEIYHEGQRRHIALTPLNGAAEVAADPHLAARGYFVDVRHPDGSVIKVPGAPYRHSETPWRITRPAPGIDQHNREVYCDELGLSEEEYRHLDETGVISTEARTVATHPTNEFEPHGTPGTAMRASAVSSAKRDRDGNTSTGETSGALSDLRVIEFTAGMAGPWIGRFMAYCGADVIKVESIARPDVSRLYVPPRQPELGVQPQLSPWFTDWNAGKRFVTLDLSNPLAVDLAKRLVAAADAVVENYTAGVMDKLGLGYAQLRAVKPDVILLSTSGYGDSGPYKRYVTWGPNIEALSGLAALSGFPERQCAITQYAYPDPLSAVHGLVAVMCALEHRRRTGRGQSINLSQLEATVGMVGDVMLEYLANGHTPPKPGNRSRRAAPHGCYRCRGDDRWCAIAVFDDDEWCRFCEAVGRSDWVIDLRFATLPARLAHAAELDAAVEEWTVGRDAHDVMQTLQSAGVAAGVVQTIEDQLRHDPQLDARGFFEEIVHAAKGTVVANGIPLGLTGTPGRTPHTGRAPGHDNEDVFAGLLGMTPKEIRVCVEAGAIEGMPRG